MKKLDKTINYRYNICWRHDTMMVTQESKYNAFHLANWFIKKSLDEHKPMTNLKLIKLCYIAYAINIVINDQPFFSEKIEAWQYGPVIPSLYHAFKKYGNGKIKEYEHNHNGILEIVDNDDKESVDVLENTWRIYGRFSGIDLSNMTHKDDTPWSNTYLSFSSIIKDELIKEHWEKLGQQ